jgi:PAS domain S-box-containing protein
MPQLKRSHLSDYIFAVLVVAAATAITWFFPLLGSRIPFALFYVAVMLSTWYGGKWPGLLATALSALLSGYLFLPPINSLNIGFEEVLLLSVFVLVSLVICSLTERAKRAETKERAVQEQLLITLKSIGDAVIATDEHGRVAFMNGVAEELTGWTTPEARGKDLREVFKIINELTRAETDNPVATVMREGMVVGLANHTLLIGKDGRETPIDDSGAPIRDEEGNITGVVLVFRDVTRRRQTEELSQRLASIVESSEDAILGKTLEGIITNWNASAAKLYGYSVEEAVGQPVTMLVPPDRPDEVPKIMEKLKRGERIEHFETKRVKKNGEVIDIALTISPIKNSIGMIIGASTIARDITEQNRARATVRANEERYRAFVVNSSEAIWRFELAEPISIDLSADEQINLCYEHGYLAECNDAMAQMYGFESAEEIVGARVADLLKRDDPQNEEYLRAFIQSGYRLAEAESSETDKEGNPKYFLNNLVGIIEDGKLLRAWGTQRDITERRQAEEERAQLLMREQTARLQAEKANRTKDEFLATLSHELRTPLTAMLGWTRMLRMNELDERTSVHALETIERNARAQAQLVEDLLDVSRIITGNLRLDVRPLDLVPVIEAALDSVRPAAEAKNIDLQINFAPLTGPVSGDPARLQQVAWNLLSNAVKFTPRDGRVRVRLERVESHIEITVTDTGEGIRPEFLPFIFDRFRQADSSTTRVHGGLGLGLAIVRHLVELHGGTVEAESKGEGEGSTFRVRLPLMAMRVTEFGRRNESAADKHGANSSTQNALLEGLRVLVVDDERDARELIRAVLEKHGARVFAAATTREALNTMEQHELDVLLSDIGMPDEDGYTLIRQIRSRPKEAGGQIPAAAVSAYVGEENRQLALDAGFHIHIAKPLDPIDLIATVQKLAASSRQ